MKTGNGSFIARRSVTDLKDSGSQRSSNVQCHHSCIKIKLDLICPNREFFTHMETSLLPAKGFKL